MSFVPSMLRTRLRRGARRTLALCALPVLAGGTSNAWSQAEDPWAPAAYFARSDDPPPAERPARDRWPDRDDQLAVLDDEDLDRWAAQANLGRAQAAINAGDHLAFRIPQARGNCAKAIRWYRRAEELGSDLAASRLGAVYSDDDCPQRNLGVAIDWWRKGVDRGSFESARALSRHLSERGTRHYDPVLALAYAEVAADNPEPWRDIVPPPADPAAIAPELTPGQISEARGIAAAAREAMRARAAGFAAAPPEETLLDRDLAESTVRIVAIDDLRECERNLIGNCRGVRRLAYVRVINASEEFLRCSFEVDTIEGKRNTPTTLQRETLVAPHARRFLRLGRISGTPRSDALRADCAPVRGYAEAVTRGTCIAQPAEPFDLESVYPKRAQEVGMEGRVELYVATNAREGAPLLVEVSRSSAAPLLEAAALDAARRMHYRSDCDAGYRRFAMEFRMVW